MSDIEKRITELFSNKDMATFIISSFATVLTIGAVLYFVYKLLIPSRKCASINDEFQNKTNTMAVSSQNTNNSLNKFYIKTAYNCCSLGNYSNDYVGTCILTAILKQGVRCLDFEIFSIDNIPVVATSTSNSYHTKETYNSLPLNDVLALISEEAFTGDISPNPDDPLFIHLRIKSNNIKMFSALNVMIQPDVLPQIYVGDVLPTTKLSELMRKIVIIVCGENKAYITSGMSYNMVSGTDTFRLQKYSQLQNLSKPEIKELINLKTMSIVIPSDGTNPDNIDLNKIINLQPNMVAMKYQSDTLTDPLLKNYNTVFSDNAFILKTDLVID